MEKRERERTWQGAGKQGHRAASATPKPESTWDCSRQDQWAWNISVKTSTRDKCVCSQAKRRATGLPGYGFCSFDSVGVNTPSADSAFSSSSFIDCSSFQLSLSRSFLYVSFTVLYCPPWFSLSCTDSFAHFPVNPKCNSVPLIR